MYKLKLSITMNGEIRRRVKVISSFPDGDSAMKAFYLKSIELSSKHAFRKMRDAINAMMRLKRCSTRGTLYKYTKYGTRSFILSNI